MDLFESLPEVKKQNILNVCIKEFAHYGYKDSSTNRISSQAGISKGSLFKYFGNKQELYFYVLDYVANEIFKELTPYTVNLPEDLLERLVYLARIELTLHLQKPLHFQLFRKAQEEDGTAVSRKVREKYGAGAEAFAHQMLTEINTANLRQDKKNTVDAVLWLLKGFNESFLSELPEATSIEQIQQEYLRQLDIYLDIIKNGIYNNSNTGEEKYDD